MKKNIFEVTRCVIAITLVAVLCIAPGCTTIAGLEKANPANVLEVKNLTADQIRINPASPLATLSAAGSRCYWESGTLLSKNDRLVKACKEMKRESRRIGYKPPSTYSEADTWLGILLYGIELSR